MSLLRLLRMLVRLVSGKRPTSYRRRANAPAFKPYRTSPSQRAFTRTTTIVRADNPVSPAVLQGRCWVIDGDTIIVDNVRLRLAGIDAPELDHPWGNQSKWALVQLCKGQTVTARLQPEMSYDRVVAECFLPNGRDLAAELVRCGLALDWPKFSGGKYRHLEPADARRKLWRADARQRGRIIPQSGT
ncbi:thermonuclease family protein [Devosia sp. UYZn731]|uniref:thermonuclease family protein n=1 Tax=Devosia sp. UYZn731 TaxID=3156345 RepID=UPI00339540EA